MIRLVPLLLVLLVLWVLLPRLRRFLKAQPPAQRRGFLGQQFLWLPALALLVLAGLGRISLWAASLALLVPIVRSAPKLWAWLGASLPDPRNTERETGPHQQGTPGGGRSSSHAREENRRQRTSDRGPSNSGSSTEQRALAILGLQAGASREEILSAYRNLARKVHPDQGGSTYLTAEINWARDTLLKRR